MYHNTEELMDLVIARMTPDELLQALCWDMSDLVHSLKDEIEEQAEEIERACRQ
jgi:hypothetical protein